VLNSIEGIRLAARFALVQYLEGWGYPCFKDEPTATLRQAAINIFNTGI
jgi:hypothetical protein